MIVAWSEFTLIEDNFKDDIRFLKECLESDSNEVFNVFYENVSNQYIHSVSLDDFLKKCLEIPVKDSSEESFKRLVEINQKYEKDDRLIKTLSKIVFNYCLGYNKAIHSSSEYSNDIKFIYNNKYLVIRISHIFNAYNEMYRLDFEKMRLAYYLK